MGYFTDLLIGAPNILIKFGGGYLIFGNSSLEKVSAFSLDALNGSNGFKFIGEKQYRMATSLNMGDINGDGYGIYHFRTELL